MGIGMEKMELVGTFERLVLMLAVQYVVGGQHGRLYHQIGTSLVEGNRVERSQYAYIGYDGSIVVVPAIALGRYVYEKADVEIGLVFQYGIGIFGNLLIEAFGRVVGSGTADNTTVRRFVRIRSGGRTGGGSGEL